MNLRRNSLKKTFLDKHQILEELLKKVLEDFKTELLRFPNSQGTIPEGTSESYPVEFPEEFWNK